MSTSTNAQRYEVTRVSRQELALWTSLLLLANTLAGLALDGQFATLGAEGLPDIVFGGGFGAIAWGVALWLLFRAPRTAASVADVALSVGLCLFGGFIQLKALPIALSGLGLWLLLTKEDDKTRAAGAVFLAIASQQFWGHLVFSALSPELVRLDAAMVGEAMVHTVKGSTWQDNIITAPSGYSIVILEGCSSFANVSTALLAWVAFGRLERAKWLRRDVIVGAVVVGSQVALNFARMYLMALSYPNFLYWHDDVGKQIYLAAASGAAVLISVVGTHWAGQTR